MRSPKSQVRFGMAAQAPTSDSLDSAPSLAVLLSMYAAEFSILILALAIYKKGDRPIYSFLGSHAGRLFLIAAAILVVSFAAIICVYRKNAVSSLHRLGLTVMLNLVTVAILLTTGELAIRIFSSKAAEQPVFLNTFLLPRSWENVVSRNRQLLRRASLNGSYLVFDDLLGWTVGANRRGADGLYFSSLEGIRSPRPDAEFSHLPATNRIALVGDSYTFGLKVLYEESWGALLEGALGPGFQVLNFGVDGYGVDQAYLRYLRDVRPWHPDIVIFGVIAHDFYRTMVVYPFVSFPEWEIPFAKPRFAMADGKLTPLNLPLISPDEIFSQQAVTDLPYLEFGGYNPADWNRRYYHSSYLVRYVLSKFPRWPTPSPYASDEPMNSINRELLRSFVNHAEEAGSVPIIVYFPSRRDLDPSQSYRTNERTLAQSVLHDGGISYVDLGPCLARVNPHDRYIAGDTHYSRHAHAAVAKCLHDVVRSHFPSSNT